MSNKYGIVIETEYFETRPDYIDSAINAVQNGAYDFVQFVVFPDSYDNLKKLVSEKFQDINVVIHAPFFMHGVDLANRDLLNSNLKRLEDSQKFADLLHSKIIVLHPGIGDGEKYLDETIHQFRVINDSRMAVENLPYHPRPNCKMHGAMPKNIQKIIAETGCKFCFDFAHAICAANSFGWNIHDTLAEFASLKPSLYHLCDGDNAATVDMHLHLGQGSYDLEMIFCDFLRNQNAMITIETHKDKSSDITAWIEDVKLARNMGLMR